MAGIVLTGVDDSETAFEAAERAATLATAHIRSVQWVPNL